MKLEEGRTSLLKHIIISNILMVILSLAALSLPLFSNQIELTYIGADYQNQKNSLNNQLFSISEDNKSSELSNRPIERMSLFLRWITSHSQFDGIQFYLNLYQYQPNFAFIKGYTTLIKGVKKIVKIVNQNLLYLENDDESFQKQWSQILLLIIFNKLLFSLTAFKIFNVAFTLTKNIDLSYRITLLYLYNPACIFFHSLYTQSIYGFLTITSVQYLLKSHNQPPIKIDQTDRITPISTRIDSNYVKSLFFLWLSVFFRTNAVFLSPIYGIPLIYQLWLQIKQKNFIKIIKIFLKGIFILAFILSPLIYYQTHIYQQLCNSEIDLKNDNKLVLQCQKFLPNLYSFIQQKFWSVGFFSYWKVSNCIFILIGIPALIIGSSIFNKIRSQLKNSKSEITNLQLTKLGLNLSFLILFVITLVLTNIQSSTRFFSTHIMFYFLIQEWVKYKITKFWIFLYYSLGAVLFNIGFPWT